MELVCFTNVCYIEEYIKLSGLFCKFSKPLLCQTFTYWLIIQSKINYTLINKRLSSVVADTGANTDISKQITPSPLSPLTRLYIYALHGCLCEVAFTASWDWYYTHDHRLAGHTSLWALLIYSSAIFCIEGLSVTLQQKHCPLPVRLTVYTLFIYLWEFSWGYLLRLFGACPWDYSEFRFNFIGLVTLEYAVPWALAALIAEKHVIRNTLKIRL